MPLPERRRLLISRKKAREILSRTGNYFKGRKLKIAAGFLGIFLTAYYGTSLVMHFKASRNLFELEHKIAETFDNNLTRPVKNKPKIDAQEYYYDLCKKKMGEAGIGLDGRVQSPEELRDIFLKGGKMTKEIYRIEKEAFEETKRTFGLIEPDEDLTKRR
ncbi:MAG: hypothetical protein ABID38_07310 [Candidatus Diapherotrites archaeon]